MHYICIYLYIQQYLGKIEQNQLNVVLIGVDRYGVSKGTIKGESVPKLGQLKKGAYQVCRVH